MKKTAFLAFFLILISSVYCRTLHIGINGGVGTAIGTGKGHWDWTDPSLGIQRRTPLFCGVSLPLLLDGGDSLQWESGAGYYRNRTEVRNGDALRSYRQDTLEIPLALRLYFARGNRGPYIKGGSALILLYGSGRFTDSDGEDNLFTGDPPENILHAGLQFGTGYHFSLGKHSGQVELNYLTFYTSPDYPRTDGTTGDVRFHRIAVNLGFFL